MSDAMSERQKVATEREAVRREQRAFERGAIALYDFIASGNDMRLYTPITASREAYPLPPLGEADD